MLKKILFVHQNFPGQYKHIAPSIAKEPNFEVSSISIKENKYHEYDNIDQHYYSLQRGTTQGIHTLASEFEAKIIRAEACANKAYELKQDGFNPDLIVGHSGWGELLFLKEVWPDTKYLTYVEFHYRLHNSDIDFDDTVHMDKTPFTRRKLIARNSPFTAQYLMSDKMVTPTEFQKSTFEDAFRKKIEVIHEGIATDFLKPSNEAEISVNGKTLSKKDKIILFLSRTLEPYRGYHIFMRALPKILEDNPDAYILIVGGDNSGYGADPVEGTTHREVYLNEVKDKVDKSRVFFTGRLDYQLLIACYQIASIHVYFTYPFVLSWSMLESMSCGGLIIGSKTGPVEEVIKHNKNGLLVDFFDVEGLTKNITKVLANPSKFDHLRENARKTIIDNYDLKKVTMPKHIKLIKEMLKA